MPRPEQLGQAPGQVGAAEPVDHLRPGLRDRGRGRPLRERRREPGQRCREREGLRVPGPGEDPHQVQVRRRVALHRLAHVAEQGDRQRAAYLVVALELHRLPAGTPGGRHRLPHRQPVPARTRPAPAATGGSASGGRHPRASGRARRARGRRARRTASRRSARPRSASARAAADRPTPPRRTPVSPGQGVPRQPGSVAAASPGLAAAAAPARRPHPAPALQPVRRAFGSTASTASPNAASKTRSNSSMSWCRLTRVSRASQYSRCTSAGGAAASASVNAVIEVRLTGTPALRSRCDRATANAARSTPREEGAHVVRAGSGHHQPNA